MKKKLILLLIVLVSFFALGTVQAATTLEVSDPYIEIGENFEVGVFAEEVAGIGDLMFFGFNVDPLLSLSFITYDGYDLGPMFTPTIFSSADVAGETLISNAGNKILLATLKFTAISAGPEVLLIEGLFNINDGTGAFYFFGDVDISANENIQIHNPVPIPSAMILLGTGLLGLMGLGRRKKS